MLIIGHRGAPSLETENTIRSFKKAQELGVDMIEMDLRKDAAGQIIASHNKKLKISNPPTIDEILKSIRQPLNLEIKESGLEVQLLQKIGSFSSEVLVSSKFPSILKKTRALDEKIKLGLILGRANFFLLPFVAVLDRSLNLYSIHLKKFLMFNIVIKYFKRHNKKIFVWVVNNDKDFVKALKLGVDAIITDFPNKFIN